jgi:hypothetical protein
MTLSRKWFPRTLNSQAVWYQNFAAKFSILGVSPLGFTPADVASVNADCEMLRFAATATAELEAFINAFRKYRELMVAGRSNAVTSAYPNLPSALPPAGAQAGILERLDKIVGRIRLAPNYTVEIGAQLGILPRGTSAPEPHTELQPSLKLATQPGSVVRVSFVRGNTEGVSLEMQLDNQGTWVQAGRFFRSPAEIVVPQNAENLPRAVKFRARYVESDRPIGLFSNIVATATMPES